MVTFGVVQHTVGPLSHSKFIRDQERVGAELLRKIFGQNHGILAVFHPTWATVYI